MSFVDQFLTSEPKDTCFSRAQDVLRALSKQQPSFSLKTKDGSKSWYGYEVDLESLHRIAGETRNWRVEMELIFAAALRHDPNILGKYEENNRMQIYFPSTGFTGAPVKAIGAKLEDIHDALEASVQDKDGTQLFTATSGLKDLPLDHIIDYLAAGSMRAQYYYTLPAALELNAGHYAMGEQIVSRDAFHAFVEANPHLGINEHRSSAYFHHAEIPSGLLPEVREQLGLLADTHARMGPRP